MAKQGKMLDKDMAEADEDYDEELDQIQELTTAVDGVGAIHSHGTHTSTDMIGDRMDDDGVKQHKFHIPKPTSMAGK